LNGGPCDRPAVKASLADWSGEGMTDRQHIRRGRGRPRRSEPPEHAARIFGLYFEGKGFPEIVDKIFPKLAILEIDNLPTEADQIAGRKDRKSKLDFVADAVKTYGERVVEQWAKECSASYALTMNPAQPTSHTLFWERAAESGERLSREPLKMLIARRLASGKSIAEIVTDLDRDPRFIAELIAEIAAGAK
jgi:hypothetical protein